MNRTRVGAQEFAQCFEKTTETAARPAEAEQTGQLEFRASNLPEMVSDTPLKPVLGRWE
jgi:hypothetical protein